MEDKDYVAFKFRGLKYWIWFHHTKVRYTDKGITGIEGWGKNGAFTEIQDVSYELVDGKIASKELQY